MKVKTLELLWHAKRPVLSVDFENCAENRLRRRFATAGGDNNVRVWSLDPLPQTSEATNGGTGITFLATISRHTHQVNCVRWHPELPLLASAGDDGCIVISEEVKDDPRVSKGNLMGVDSEGNNDADENTENWKMKHFIRAGSPEIFDICWSPCGRYIATACVDNTTRVYSLETKRCISTLTDHTKFVQGVAWDPSNRFVVSQSTDRSVLIYSVEESLKKINEIEAHNAEQLRLQQEYQSQKLALSKEESSTTTTTTSEKKNDEKTAGEVTPMDVEVKVKPVRAKIQPQLISTEVKRITPVMLAVGKKPAAGNLSEVAPIASTTAEPSPVTPVAPVAPIVKPAGPPAKFRLQLKTVPNLEPVKLAKMLDLRKRTRVPIDEDRENAKDEGVKMESTSSETIPENEKIEETEGKDKMETSNNNKIVKSDSAISLGATEGADNGDLETAKKRVKTVDPYPIRQQRIYIDEQLTSFYRRCTFSPEGSLFVSPCGVYKKENAVFIYSKASLLENNFFPIVQLSGFKKAAIAVRFSPVLYKPHPNIQESDRLLKFPGYSMIFAVACQDALVIFSTDSTDPIAYVSNLHYATLTDVCFSQDGKSLLMTSVDGFVSVINFEDSDLPPVTTMPTNTITTIVN